MIPAQMRAAYAHFPINIIIADDSQSVEIRNFLGEKVGIENFCQIRFKRGKAHLAVRPRPFVALTCLTVSLSTSPKPRRTRSSVSTDCYAPVYCILGLKLFSPSRGERHPKRLPVCCIHPHLLPRQEQGYPQVPRRYLRQRAYHRGQGGGMSGFLRDGRELGRRSAFCMHAPLCNQGRRFPV
jgi:hypothetical protein